MINYDKFDNRYEYYLYPTDNVEECLENGIELSYGFDLCSSLESITKYVYADSVDAFIEEKYMDKDNFLIIKIPLYYMGWRHRNGVKESFVPIIKSYTDEDNLSSKRYLIPELIYGLYNKKNNKYMYNDKYNLFFDPSGLHFCSEQIEEMYELRCYDLCQESLSRQKSDYEDLVMFDIMEHKWDNTMKYYMSSKIKKRILNINKNKFGRR